MQIVVFLLFAMLAAAQTRPVIGLGGIVHETNTFNPKMTTLADFEIGAGGADGILRGQDLIALSVKANNTTAGFIEGARQPKLCTATKLELQAHRKKRLGGRQSVIL